jgi:DNA-binding SARP family transcriptional activator
MDFRVLGPLEVWRDGLLVEVRGGKRRALLAILVLHANDVVRTERLIDELWGESPPESAVASLHNHVSRLRKDLGGEVIATRPWGYVLRTEPDAIDFNRFQTLVSEAQPLPARERAKRLREALALWRGSPLSDLGDEWALRDDIERLESVRVDAVEQRIEADLQMGRNGELVPELEALVAAHPLRERLRGQLILALYRAGRQAEALETYRETRRVLIEELGIEPSAELRELERAVLRQDPALAPANEAATDLPAAGLPSSGRRRGRAVVLAALLGLVVTAGTAAAILVVYGGNVDDRAAHTAAARSERGATTDLVAGMVARPSSRNPETTGTTPQSTTPKPAATASYGTRRHTTPGSTTPRQTTDRPAAPSPTPRHARRRRAHRAETSPAVPASPTGNTSSRPQAGKERKSSSGPRLFVLADKFGSPAFNSALWDRGEAGSGVDFVEDGRLEVSVAANASPGGQVNLIEGQYRTNCGLTGNFDARVDFNTVTWPRDNGVSIVLGADFPGDFAVVSRASLDWGEGYWSNFGSWPHIATDDASGGLRLTRTDGLITSYYRQRGRWVKVDSRASPRAPAHLVLQLASYPPASFSGPVAAAFDNFHATARYVECPPGVPLPPRVGK